MADPATDPIHVEIQDDDNGGVRVDPATGAVEIDTDDGGVVVQFNPQKPDDESVDNPADFYKNIASKIGEGDPTCHRKQCWHRYTTRPTARFAAVLATLCFLKATLPSHWLA